MNIPKIDILLYLCNRIIARIPSHSLRLAFYRKVMGFEIGSDAYIFMDAWFNRNLAFKIGDNSVINQKCRLDNRGGITIGKNVSISSDVIILTADHDPNAPDFAGREAPVEIGDFCFIGTRAMILPGVTVGTGAIVAAGAVVTKAVIPYTIVAGVPAKSIGRRRTDLDYRIDYGRFLH